MEVGVASADVFHNSNQKVVLVNSSLIELLGSYQMFMLAWTIGRGVCLGMRPPN